MAKELDTGGSTGPLILIVEDDRKIAGVEQFILEEEGYVVAVARSGEEALERILASRPDLVLLDVGLPGMDGFATCRRIREISEVPVIMVTGQRLEDHKIQGLEAGADDYVTKPFSVNELLARVKAALRRPSITAPEVRPELGMLPALTRPGHTADAASNLPL